MTKTAIIFGGTGYIGTRLALHLRERGWKHVRLADIKPPPAALPPGIEFSLCDVRESIARQIGTPQADWIFNFAAVHREPGHAYAEYFDTNLPGARNVCDFAHLTGCNHVFFTSSIAVYGQITRPADEDMPTYPDTAYGISKLCAEIIHQGWQMHAPDRRLVVVRPGVIYGPGETGNIPRMLRAIRKGVFVMPGDGSVRKSYGYIFGLLDSIEFMLSRPEPFLRYNYVERETEPLRELVRQAASVLAVRRPRLRAPVGLLVAIARGAQAATRGRSPIHPVRVRKAALSTHIVPAELVRLGFDFRFDFATSLRHWRSVAPQDFTSGPQVASAVRGVGGRTSDSRS